MVLLVQLLLHNIFLLLLFLLPLRPVRGVGLARRVESRIPRLADKWRMERVRQRLIMLRVIHYKMMEWDAIRLRLQRGVKYRARAATTTDGPGSATEIL